MAEIMTLENPRWNEFAGALEDAIHAVQDKPGVSDCKHDFASTRKILAEMCVDVEASIAYFEENGGYCDCEVLLNVERDSPFEEDESEKEGEI